VAGVKEAPLAALGVKLSRPARQTAATSCLITRFPLTCCGFLLAPRKTGLVRIVANTDDGYLSLPAPVCQGACCVVGSRLADWAAAKTATFGFVCRQYAHSGRDLQPPARMTVIATSQTGTRWSRRVPAAEGGCPMQPECKDTARTGQDTVRPR